MSWIRVFSGALLLVCAVACGGPARALETLTVNPDVQALDLTHLLEHFTNEGDRIQVTTAPGADGIVRRVEVHAREPGSSPVWSAFALTNNSDVQLDRLIVAPHYRLVGSGVLWPDLGAVRIVELSSSQGFRPERQSARDADVFLVTIDPGATVTFVAELASQAIPQIYVWNPEAYKDNVNNLTLYRGIVLGIAGLLAMMLTIVFVVRGSIMFPAAAALAWAVLGWLSIDFGFWDRLFDITPEQGGIYRAAAEALLAATMIVFLVAYLNLNRWHVRFVHVAIAWLAGLLALVAIAMVDAPVAAGISRLSLAFVAVLGFGVVLWLALHGYDRAVMLIPTWFLLLVWVGAAALTVTGMLSKPLVAPALIGGLVLIVLLIGFTVMQHAFGGAGLAYGMGTDVERRALALAGSGDVVWDWDVAGDRIHVSGEFEQALGLGRGDLQSAAAEWLDVLHPSDRDRFRAALDAVVEERRGRISQQFRFRGQDGHYRWMLMRARPVLSESGEVGRCVGTLVDITDAKTAQERLLHNAVRDNLTGLPNRELFLDRLDTALALSREDLALRPTVIVLDLDGYKKVNEAVGNTVGDTILLTLVRRIGRLLKPHDTVARLGGDQFGIILLSEHDPRRIVDFADQLRRTLCAPITFAGREIVLTASFGLALSDPEGRTGRDDMVRNAEVAMFHAKRLGGDHIEVFKPAMRAATTDRLLVEGELRRALERNEIRILYEPIVRLDDRSVAGFEATMRWDNRRYARRPAAEFITIAEETGLIGDFGAFMIESVARQLATWQRTVGRRVPLFATLSVSPCQFERSDFLQVVKSAVARAGLPRGTLLLALSETAIAQRPEHADNLLGRLHEAGVALALDDFGAGPSSIDCLQRFPFDMVKLDRSLVRAPARGPRPVVLRSVIQLGVDLRLDVTAEGAEAEADAAELARLGCHYAQGPLFGEAVDAAGVERLLMPKEKLQPFAAVRRTVFGASRA